MASLRLSDIAKLAGVSKSTASRALADSPRVNIETKEFIKKIAKEHNYKPNSIGKAIATKKTRIIGFLIHNEKPPYVGKSFLSFVLDAAIDEASKHKYHFIMSMSSKDNDTFDENFISDSIDGTILISNQPNAAVKEFKKREIPLVLINESLNTENNAFILDDNYNGMMKIMEHLIVDKGHKSIAFLVETLNHPGFLPRYIAYLDAHKKYNLPIYNDPYLKKQISACNYNFPNVQIIGTPIFTNSSNAYNSYKPIRTFLENCEKLPTALACSCDTVAFATLKALYDLDIKVPQDIAVTGYDDDNLATEVSIPPLTTIRVDLESIGRTAVKELISQIENPNKPSRNVIIKNQLIIRNST